MVVLGHRDNTHIEDNMEMREEDGWVTGVMYQYDEKSKRWPVKTRSQRVYFPLIPAEKKLLTLQNWRMETINFCLKIPGVWYLLWKT
jgi:hypothetical protein